MSWLDLRTSTVMIPSLILNPNLSQSLSLILSPSLNQIPSQSLNQTLSQVQFLIPHPSQIPNLTRKMMPTVRKKKVSRIIT